MAKNEIDMRKIAVLALTLALGAAVMPPLGAQDYSYHWKLSALNGSLTGTTPPSTDDVRECLGSFEHGKYVAPNGRTFKRGTAAARAAKVMIGVQPEMVSVKQVVGYSTREMIRRSPESEISDWFIDTIMKATESLSGRRVDVGIANFGGIRADMPQGPVILDDLMSMFPFKNQIVYLEISGADLLEILEDMAAGRFQVLGGVRVVAKDHRLLSAEIGGKAIDPVATYGLATISFLLDGGDGLHLAENAKNIQLFKDVDIIDIILEDVRERSAAGKPIEYSVDGRVKILDTVDNKQAAL